LRTVALPDGSLIQLNTDSAVEVAYTLDERRVALSRGEAHFTVAKNPARPFIVSVAGVDVRVVGTVFNVRLRNAAVDVLVTQGKVRVDSPGGAAAGNRPSAEEPQAELTAGQKLSIDLHLPAMPLTKRAELSTVEIKQALAWQSRRLDFDAAPLEEIVAEMNRYNRHKLVVADPRLNSQRFGGSFPAGDCATIVRMLEANFGVVAERVQDETRLRLKASPAGR
jgi:transmembrane sensor